MTVDEIDNPPSRAIGVGLRKRFGMGPHRLKSVVGSSDCVGSTAVHPCIVQKSAAVGRVEMWRGGGRLSISVAAPHMGVIRSRGFVPSFSPFVSDPKSEPSMIRARFTGARINLTYGRRSSAVVPISRLRAGKGSRGRDQSFVRPF